MPFTLAHAAAVLPFANANRWRLSAIALVFGAFSPDLAYAFGIARSISHVPAGLLPVCLPLTIGGVLWAEVVLLPFLRAIVPAGLGVDWPRLFVSSGLPRSVSAWMIIVVSALIGAGTHMLWDGLTHPGWWPTTLLYPDTTFSFLGSDYHVAWLYWGGSTAVGGTIIYMYLIRRFPGPMKPLGGDTRFFTALLWMSAGSVLLGLAWAVLVRGTLARGTFSGASTFLILVSLTILSLVHRSAHRRANIHG
jgi:hypothetical protein